MNHTTISSERSPEAFINTILFDLDNTLLFTREVDRATCVVVTSWLEKQGLPQAESKKITEDFLRRFREAPAPDFSTDIDGLDKWRLDIWATVLPDKYDQYIDQNDVFSIWKAERLKRLLLKQSVTDMLVGLAPEFNLGLITNGPSVAQWEKINNTGCQKYFDSIIVSGDLDVEKPSKDIYDLACNELQVSPSECIMVGDKIETDIRGGVNAGVGATVWVNARNKAAPSDVHPDFTISKVTELPDILFDLTAFTVTAESL